MTFFLLRKRNPVGQVGLSLASQRIPLITIPKPVYIHFPASAPWYGFVDFRPDMSVYLQCFPDFYWLIEFRRRTERATQRIPSPGSTRPVHNGNELITHI